MSTPCRPDELAEESPGVLLARARAQRGGGFHPTLLDLLARWVVEDVVAARQAEQVGQAPEVGQ